MCKEQWIYLTPKDLDRLYTVGEVELGTGMSKLNSNGKIAHLILTDKARTISERKLDNI
jgi:hypothetical protein